jgi:hypothetical protein
MRPTLVGDALKARIGHTPVSHRKRTGQRDQTSRAISCTLSSESPDFSIHPAPHPRDRLN